MALPAVPARLLARLRRDLGEDAVRVEDGRLVVTPGTAAEARLAMRECAEAGGVPVRVDPVRLDRLVQIDMPNRRIVVEPGMPAEAVLRAVEPYGFLPTDRVSGLEVITVDGDLIWLGGRTAETPGYDLIELFLTDPAPLGVVTKLAIVLASVPEEPRARRHPVPRPRVPEENDRAGTS